VSKTTNAKVSMTLTVDGTISDGGFSADEFIPPFLSEKTEEVIEVPSVEVIDEAPVSPLLGKSSVEEAVQPEYTKKRLTLMGAIRAGWMMAFGGIGEALVYAADNLGVLSLPPGTGLVVGSVMYGIKRAIKPDGLV
jgi:hypothetical protein